MTSWLERVGLPDLRGEAVEAIGDIAWYIVNRRYKGGCKEKEDRGNGIWLCDLDPDNDGNGNNLLSALKRVT